MDKITNKLVPSFQTNETLTAENMNKISTAINDVITDKINQLIDWCDSLSTSLSATAIKVNEIQDHIANEGTLDTETTVSYVTPVRERIVSRTITIGIDSEAGGHKEGRAFYLPQLSIQADGIYKWWMKYTLVNGDEYKYQNMYMNTQQDIIDAMTPYDIKIQDQSSEYLPEKVSFTGNLYTDGVDLGTNVPRTTYTYTYTTITYKLENPDGAIYSTETGMAEKGAKATTIEYTKEIPLGYNDRENANMGHGVGTTTVQLDMSKGIRFEMNYDIICRHGMQLAYMYDETWNTYRKYTPGEKDKYGNTPSALYFMNVPTIYEFLKYQKDYPNQIAYGDCRYGETDDPVEDTKPSQDTINRIESAETQKIGYKSLSINPDNYDYLAEAAGTVNDGRVWWRYVGDNFLIRDAAFIKPSAKVYFGNDTTRTLYGGYNIRNQAIMEKAVNPNADISAHPWNFKDSGSWYGSSKYERATLSPVRDAVLGCIYFVIPGEGWNNEKPADATGDEDITLTNVDWNDFISRPQYYIDQYLGRSGSLTHSDSNNEREKHMPNWLSKAIYFHRGIFDSDAKYDYSSKREEIQKAFDAKDKTNYSFVSKMYYLEQGFRVNEYGSYENVWEDKGHCGQINLRPGDIFVILASRHAPSGPFVDVLLGDKDGRTVKNGFVALNTGINTTQYDTTAKDWIGASDAIRFDQYPTADKIGEYSINVPYQDIIADKYHDTDTLMAENPSSPALYKRYGGRDYVLTAYRIGRGWTQKDTNPNINYEVPENPNNQMSFAQLGCGFYNTTPDWAY